MSAGILDGKAVQAQLITDLQAQTAILKSRDITPGIGTILVGADPASAYYIKSLKHSLGEKIGLKSIHAELPETASTADVLALVDEFNANPDVHGFIVQLPLPAHIDIPMVLERIDPAKDADGLHPTNLGKLVLSQPAPLPCTPSGIVHLLRAYGIPLDGAKVTVIGRGITVGRTIGLLLTRKSENATVTLTHTGTKNLVEHTRSADIIIAAAGVPGMINAEMIRDGAVLIDVGVSRVDGKVVGDLAPDVWDKAAWVSPNPGGVGPLTVGFLMQNVILSAQRQLI